MYKRSRVNINAEPRSTFTLVFLWLHSAAAVLVDKTTIFLRCELNSLSCKVCNKNCVDGRLVTNIIYVRPMFGSVSVNKRVLQQIYQRHPTTFFCKRTLRRSKYFPEISKARERLNLFVLSYKSSNIFRGFFTVTFLQFSRVVFFTFPFPNYLDYN